MVVGIPRRAGLVVHTLIDVVIKNFRSFNTLFILESSEFGIREYLECVESLLDNSDE